MCLQWSERNPFVAFLGCGLFAQLWSQDSQIVVAPGPYVYLVPCSVASSFTVALARVFCKRTSSEWVNRQSTYWQTDKYLYISVRCWKRVSHSMGYSVPIPIFPANVVVWSEWFLWKDVFPNNPPKHSLGASLCDAQNVAYCIHTIFWHLSPQGLFLSFTSVVPRSSPGLDT